MRPDAPESPLVLCCLLWAKPGQAEALTSYEDRVLAFVPEHGGSVRQRAMGEGADGQPNEVQLFVFPDRAALSGYLADPRRLALVDERDAAVVRTELVPVELA